MSKIFRELLNDIREFENTPEGQGYDFRLDLADIIYRHLTDRGWTQKRLADATGMKAPQLTRIMHALSNCTFDTAGKILFALGAKGKLIEVGHPASTHSRPDAAKGTTLTLRIEETANVQGEINQFATPTVANLQSGTGGSTAGENRSKVA